MAVERVDGGHADSPWREEHAARYHWAAPQVDGGHVLDIACGTGYGAAILLDAGAGSLVAADLSEAALESSRGRLAAFGERAEVRREDCLALSFPDGTFDAVVSMETIEHLPEPDRFLDEVVRVLRPGGLLLLSTPNALVTNPTGGVPENPFHVHEFTPRELSELVGGRMEIEAAVGQHVPAGYGVAPFLPSFRPGALGIRQRMNALYWSVLLRLPPLRDPIHRAVTGFSFYPGESDYTFRPEDLESAHVQVLVCRKAVS
jgi:SAM-dependent methyltransferase